MGCLFGSSGGKSLLKQSHQLVAFVDYFDQVVCAYEENGDYC